MINPTLPNTLIVLQSMLMSNTEGKHDTRLFVVFARSGHMALFDHINCSARKALWDSRAKWYSSTRKEWGRAKTRARETLEMALDGAHLSAQDKGLRYSSV